MKSPSPRRESSPNAPSASNEEAALRTLWARFRAHGDVEAKTRLLANYAYLVRFIVGKMKVSLVPSVGREDLESVGAIGLVKALERYDPSREVKFETYAYRWVQGGVLDYLRQLDVLGRGGRDRVNHFKKAFSSLRDDLGRDPNDEEICARLGWSVEDLHQTHFDMSIDLQKPLDNFGTDDDEKGESLPDRREKDALESLEKKEIIARLEAGIEALPEKEKTVLSLYYYEDMTFKEIGEILGVTESRVCQIHGRAIMEVQKCLSFLKEEKP